MNTWLTWLLKWLVKWWFGQAKLNAVEQAKANGIQAYLKLLRGAKLTLAGGIAALFFLQMFAFGLALMLSAAMFLLPLDLEMKLWLVFGLGALLFFAPLIILLFLFSDRIWYRATGAEKMVNQVLEKNAS